MFFFICKLRVKMHCKITFVICGIQMKLMMKNDYADNCCL